MKTTTLLALSFALLGCRSAGTIAVIPHADGCGSTEVGFAAVGGGARPGVMIVWTKQHGNSNSVPPRIVANVHGAPSLPSLLGGTASAVGEVGAALTLGTVWPDSETTTSTTVIQGDAPAPPMVPLPPQPSRPPWGPPNGWDSKHPHNRGH